ncbi:MULTISPECIES: thioredoxin [unclassified Dietzia]|uniref:thioredoxin n=1 Tax=unclassified Dietzia TaxID=2617939 RepID=UPI000D226143|nr:MULTISPECIES: thioredoxin [unclassified Dietzia]AVZ40001.1 thioredoxin [Dietzia sp. JS16-p6b]MBB1023178.1 thioredoxin [Dietzia sp. DQ12-76]MBB1027076.1 thioredoxin [Dietzia sp. DQ11-38-2]QGW25415.1 putative thioredoxin [Dietzia sp. DQ12-45-1b]
MTTVDITTADFEKTVTDNDIVLVDFWAEWCGPCKAFGPVFEKVSGKNPELVFAKVDTDAEQQLGAMLQIQSIPTLMAFREGIAVFRHSGAIPEQALDDLVEQIKGLDMDEVRKAVEEAQAQQGDARA